MVHNVETNIGGTTIHLQSDGTNAKAIVECDVFSDCACLEIPMTDAQMKRVLLRVEGDSKRESIQDILPNTPRECREVFITGMTPAMWDEDMNGERKHWRHYKALGYKFEFTPEQEQQADEHDQREGRVKPEPTTVDGKPVEVINPEDLNENNR